MRLTGPFTLTAATEREWLVTNGLGSYASATICGMNTRRYHGLLVAALHPPGARNLLVSKLEEELHVGEAVYQLATNQYPGVYYPTGYDYQTEFELVDDSVALRFAAGGARLEKQIAMVHGENTTRVRYRNTGDVDITLRLTPLVNARDFHGETAAESIAFDVEPGAWALGPRVRLRPWWLPEGFWLYADAGDWEDEGAWYRNMVYVWERRRGLTDVDNHFSPGHFRVALQAGEDRLQPGDLGSAAGEEVLPGLQGRGALVGHGGWVFHSLPV